MLLIDLRPELAETLGTFALVLVGAGAIMADAAGGGLGTVGIALAFGFVVLVMVSTFGHISGAHLNPAITIGFAATGHFPWSRVPSYVVAQAVGATSAALMLSAIIGQFADMGATRLQGVGTMSGIIIEIVATFFLAITIIAVATDKRTPPGAAGLAIGLAVAMGSLFAGPFTGASMNPARSLGPAVVSGDLSFLWIYMIGPVVGAVLAMMTYEFLRPASLQREEERAVGALGPVPLVGEEEHA